jgi:CIC family chloride channel protein
LEQGDLAPHHEIDPPREGHLLMLALIAPIVGVAAGLVCALFRLALEAAVHGREFAIGAAQTLGLVGLPIVMATCAVAVGAAAWMVRRYSPHATGSGIPHVEAVIEGEMPPAGASLVPIKFVGGVLAIGSGLALGREGPSVQMGASIAHLVGRIFRRDWADCRVLMAAGAGSGLATAFNAPIAGAVFVLEELVRRFEPRIAIVILAATASAISVARVLLGDASDFHIDVVDYGNPITHMLYGVLGIVAGLAGILHNRIILGGMALAGRLSFIPVEIRAGTVGALVGLIAWYLPDMVGGGDKITQAALLGQQTLMMIPLILILRMTLGSASYAAGTPGGLFAPMLVLGALLGLGVGIVLHAALPFLPIQPAAFAVVGMAAFFVGSVRAPVTGIVLVTEMTASVDLLVPMLGACFAAMLVPTLLKDPPIYDSLRVSTLRREADRLRRS